MLFYYNGNFALNIDLRYDIIIERIYFMGGTNMKKVVNKSLSIFCATAILIHIVILPVRAAEFVDTQNLNEECRDALQYCVDRSTLTSAFYYILINSRKF